MAILMVVYLLLDMNKLVKPIFPVEYLIYNIGIGCGPKIRINYSKGI